MLENTAVTLAAGLALSSYEGALKVDLETREVAQAAETEELMVE